MFTYQAKIDQLNPDDNNARKHSDKNIKAIAESLKQFGQRKPIVVWNNTVIAGNGTLEAAISLGWNEIEVTEVPDDWDEKKARAYALADNRTAELAEWDLDVLDELLEDLRDSLDLGSLGFDEELKDDSEDNPYTAVINLPQYEITGEMPTVFELADSTKTDQLLDEINQIQLPSEIREFLCLGAYRHTVFNYRKIAEYYAHATPEVQELLEKSALVIIDINNAMRDGYINIAKTLKELQEADRE
jgi:ParB-like nuclease domain